MTLNWDKIDKFYLSLSIILILMSVLLIFSLRGVFSLFLNAYDLDLNLISPQLRVDKEKLDKAGIWNKPIVTEITPFKKFYVPESYHQNYYNENMNKPYCSIVITPKIEKFRKIFSDKVISTTGK